jgi:hypothetical protein
MGDKQYSQPKSVAKPAPDQPSVSPSRTQKALGGKTGFADPATHLKPYRGTVTVSPDLSTNGRIVLVDDKANIIAGAEARESGARPMGRKNLTSGSACNRLKTIPKRTGWVDRLDYKTDRKDY